LRQTTTHHRSTGQNRPFHLHSYSCNRPWSPIRLRDVEAATFSRQSAHRWRWGCQLYAPAALYPPGRFLVLISARGWVDPRTKMWLEGLGELKISNELIRNRSRDLPACNIVRQPTTLPRCPITREFMIQGVKRLNLLICTGGTKKERNIDKR
jgi:hypothetical protein